MDSGTDVSTEDRMIRQVVFDIGNVMSDFQWQNVIDTCGFSAEAAAVLAERIFRDPLWEEYDRGVIGDENVTAALRKNCAGYEKEFDALYEHFGDLVVEREYAAGLVEELKKNGYQVYVLSNYGDTMYRKNGCYFQFLKLVDGCVFSWQEKLIKPDPKIYQLLLSRFGIKGEETLFLDDRAVNVEAARREGIWAEIADSRETIFAALKMHGIEI